ncbi:pentapeptide repeat-containing protein [Rothia mucilaginosa]|uniref:pentapeptide repeat-containing protein n=1 Tax=Rothia mucilaginosa TaxID=43675 RepID=UPI0028ED32A8|nr:pentapeptide repeat-containing protein [Rothia mucilaginosa]
MSEQDTSSDPQNNSASGTPSPSGTPNNQANSNPVTESEKSNNQTAKTPKKERKKQKKKILNNIKKYITKDNPNLDIDEINKKYPIETLTSIFWIQEKDRKIILWTPLLLLLAHTIFYYLKLPQSIEIVRIVIVDLLRITIATILLIFAIKNVYSAYQNRLIIVESFKKYPLQFFTTIIAVGGLFALTIPAVMNVLKLIGDSSALTTAILSITGGFIALFGLIKSHQKSELEREQLEVQKRKDAQEHIRQVHATRRNRYLEAVDKLSSKDATARLGGIYALFGLIDEWLTDNSLKNKDHKKEAQIIVNNLCAYIRSPFLIADSREFLEGDSDPSIYKSVHNRDFFKDRAKLREEQKVRRAIFQEISNRISQNNPKEYLWKSLNYDFSFAPIFYPLASTNFINVSFEGAEFHGLADFKNSTFNSYCNFTKGIFYGKSSFENSKFQKANFSEAKFLGNAIFNCSTFTIEANFEESKFEKIAEFIEVKMLRRSLFSNCTFESAANFSYAHLTRLNFNFANSVNEIRFHKSKFKKTTLFNAANLLGYADFSHARFKGKSYFYETRFEGLSENSSIPSKTIFNGSKFKKYARFSIVSDGEIRFTDVIFKNKSKFTDSFFNGIVDFSNAQFKKTSNFDLSEFMGFIDFSKVRFTEDVTFEETNFGEIIQGIQSPYIYARKSGECILFCGAEFRGNTKFCGTNFYKGPDFSQALFSCRGNHIFQSRSTMNTYTAKLNINNGTIIEKSLPVSSLLYNFTYS